ncbi:MAG TPA: ATP synthase F1 subunit epsilon [bacterium]|nr:ATP synthase F1 subunit epsilon [bacterium]
MDNNKYHLEIISPRHVVFKGEVESFTAPGARGSFQILKNHTAYISSVLIGEVKIRHTDGYDEIYATSGGFVEVEHNKVTFLAETCEKVSSIDLIRAQESYERARKRLEDRSSYDPERSRQALLRSRNRLRLAEKYNKQ